MSDGLFQTPSIANAGGRVDLTRFARADDGSFLANPSKLVVVPASTALPGGYSVEVGSRGIATSVDMGRAWHPGTFVGPVDDFVFPYAGNIDIQAIAAGGSVLVSRDRGATWQEMGRGLPFSKYALSASNGILLAAGAYFVLEGSGRLNDSAGVHSFICRALDCPRKLTVVETSSINLLQV